jgi:hypothetical protein
MQKQVEDLQAYQKAEDRGCNSPDHRARPAVRGSLKRREEETRRSGSATPTLCHVKPPSFNQVRSSLPRKDLKTSRHSVSST